VSHFTHPEYPLANLQANLLIPISWRPHQSVGGRLYEFGVKKNWFLTVKNVVSVWSS